jgi:hypothetical protein
MIVPSRCTQLAFTRVTLAWQTPQAVFSDRFCLHKKSLQAKIGCWGRQRISGWIEMTKGPQQAPEQTGPFSKAAVDNDIKRLRRIEEACFGPRHKKTEFYEYLEGVLKLYFKWKDGDFAGKAAKRVLAKLYPDRVKIRSNTHTTRSIIDASSKQDRQTKSRWTNALRYAVKNRATVKDIGLGGFFGKNGGPAGCERKMAAIGKARKGARRPVAATTAHVP